MLEPKEIAIGAAKALDAKKARGVVVLEIGHRTVIADYMVIASGRSGPQVTALLESLEERLALLGARPRRREGAGEARWAVLDYGSVIVHVFHEEEREYYQLERLWEDGTNRLIVEGVGEDDRPGTNGSL